MSMDAGVTSVECHSLKVCRYLLLLLPGPASCRSTVRNFQEMSVFSWHRTGELMLMWKAELGIWGSAKDFSCLNETQD